MPRPGAVTHLCAKFRGEMTLKGVGKTPWRALATTDVQLRSLQKQAGAKKIIYYSCTNGSDIKVKHNGKGDQRRELDFGSTRIPRPCFWRRCCYGRTRCRGGEAAQRAIRRLDFWKRGPAGTGCRP